MVIVVVPDAAGDGDGAGEGDGSAEGVELVLPHPVTTTKRKATSTERT
jgi:hypothetical protein